MPEVSVIIPFYAGVDWLKEAVDSVLLQTFKDYEIIVVNDGSPENMTEFLAQYSNKIKYIKKENGGPSTARNTGIETATGKYIAFLDSDDRWLPKKLEIQLEYMKKNDVIWSYCGYRTFGVGESVEYKMTNSDVPIVHRYNTPYIATPCVMIERQYLVDYPNVRFNPDLRFGQDSYFWLMINADNPILAIPDVLVEVRIRGENASKRARVQIQARSNVWKCRKNNKEQLIDKYNISILFKLASELCVVDDKMISVFEKNHSPKIVEKLSKIFFVLPWALFKIDRKINGKYV
ncbi:glycosyltransferase family 2 protein [Merdimonas faecis]|uniref:glycosyltransferase family 2 protein n=1 Tax=Merdimonas faecis TaxID=1653435 RepID=UPI00086365C8|nr:glycosyltransferase family 2 protein [Merdimonas faecis]